MSQEKLFYPAVITVFRDGEYYLAPYNLYQKHKNDPIGTQIKSYAGAPGVGYTIHEITRITEEGIYARCIEDTTYVPGIEFYE